MSTVRITINTDNAAFDDEEELPRILDRIARQWRSDSYAGGPVRDSNGNSVGTWAMDGDDE